MRPEGPGRPSAQVKPFGGLIDWSSVGFEFCASSACARAPIASSRVDRIAAGALSGTRLRSPPYCNVTVHRNAMLRTSSVWGSVLLLTYCY